MPATWRCQWRRLRPWVGTCRTTGLHWPGPNQSRDSKGRYYRIERSIRFPKAILIHCFRGKRLCFSAIRRITIRSLPFVIGTKAGRLSKRLSVWLRKIGFVQLLPLKDSRFSVQTGPSGPHQIGCRVRRQARSGPNHPRPGEAGVPGFRLNRWSQSGDQSGWRLQGQVGSGSNGSDSL